MRVLIIDNYDSFTYNLFHYAEQFADVVEVKRNDEISILEIAEFDKLIISPGPGLPIDAGITMQVLEKYHNRKPILGVCLGFQAIVEYYGGALENMPTVVHGKAKPCLVVDPSEPLFQGLPPTFPVGRYHSWAANKSEMPSSLKTTAEDEQGRIMACRHMEHDVCGVQFHPESIMTEGGLKMIENWIRG